MIIKQNVKIDSVIHNLLSIFNNHPCYYIDCISNWGGYYSSIIDCLKSINFIYKNNIENINNFDTTLVVMLLHHLVGNNVSENIKNLDICLKQIRKTLIKNGKLNQLL